MTRRYRRMNLLDEPIDKCATCGIRAGNRLFPVHEIDGTLRCDKCVTEASRGALMVDDPDDLAPRIKAHAVRL